MTKEIIYASFEISAMAHSTPSESLRSELVEDIKRGIYRQITQAQIDVRVRIDELIKKIPMAKENLREQYPQWTEEDIQTEISILIEEYSKKIHEESETTIEALKGLLYYRVQELDNWLQNQSILP